MTTLSSVPGSSRSCPACVPLPAATTSSTRRRWTSTPSRYWTTARRSASRWPGRTLRANREGAATLARELEALGIEVWPTDANFLLAKTGAGSYELLLREGVIVRPLAGFGLPEHLRITIGTAKENEKLLKALHKIREGAR